MSALPSPEECFAFAIPGDLDKVRQLIARMSNGSQNVDTMRRTITDQTLEGEWSGAASAEYSAARTNCANDLVNLGAALDDARHALVKFLAELEETQHTAKRIEGELWEGEAERESAQARVSDARQSVTQAQADRDAALSPHDRLTSETALRSATSSLRAAEVAADDARTRVKSLSDAGWANRHRYEGAVAALRGALSGAHTYAPREPKLPPSPLGFKPGPDIEPSEVFDAGMSAFDL